MKNDFGRKFLLVLFSIAFSQGFVSDFYGANTITKAQASQWMQATEQLGFQENKGQMMGADNLSADYVLFKAEAPGLNIWLTTTGLTYQFFTIDKKLLTNDDGSPKLDFDGKQRTEKNIRWKRVDMVLKGASIKKANLHTANNITQGNVSYYLEHCPDGIFNVKTFTKIIIEEVYPGIDWILYTSETGGLKHDFVVHPGADPQQIKLIYEGNGNIEINKHQLQFSNDLGNITEGQLLCYQDNPNNAIPSAYKVNKNNSPLYLGRGITHYDLPTTIPQTNKQLFSYEFSLDLSDYDKTKDLVIDPQLVWGTLYGGNGVDGFMSMDIDINNNLFVTGYNSLGDFPTENSGGYYQGLSSGSTEPIILKFNNAGERLWATYYGGSSSDWANSITTDFFGNVWLTGYTESSNFPVQDTGTFFQGANAGGGGTKDAFILKFDNDGNRIWATYYGAGGGDEEEAGNSITVDFFGNVWITGWTNSSDFPVQDTGTFFQGTLGGTGPFGADAFLLKFDNAGNRLWATFYGGIGGESGNAITTDLFGNVWITGYTTSTDFPVQDTGTFFQGVYGGGFFKSDAFILKFDNLGNRIWATYYGGDNTDRGKSIITDDMGNVWIAGRTESTDFPIEDAGTFFQGVIAGESDVFLLKFDNNGNRILATYYGGSKTEPNVSDTYDNLAIDSNNNVYMAFSTNSVDILTLNPDNCYYYDDSMGGGLDQFGIPLSDNFITQFDNMGNLLWASYIGGDSSDFRAPIAIDDDNNLFMGGEFTLYETAITLPLENSGGGAYFDNTPNGADDSYILKFSPPQAVITQAGTYCLNDPADTLQAFDTGGLWSGNGMVDSIFFPVIAGAGTHEIIYTVCGVSDTTSIVVESLPPISLGPDATICKESINLSVMNVANGSSYLWSTGETSTSIVIDQSGAYWVSIIDSPCSVVDSINVDSSCIITNIFIPNAFSPNGDGANDIFRIVGIGIKEIEFRVYDRWGNNVFETKSSGATLSGPGYPGEGWDGTNNGKQLSEGVYVYHITGSFNNGDEIDLKGNVSLVR